ncbi:MAG TPA: adenylyltransferase/cytidyltransferase family protein, partial [Clostridia bacterium]|nr:adenylyltransferase/cytidyltransferase family protein [Clostridia bacterium]
MTGFVTGTFDPITIGHLEVIHRAKEVFSRVVVLFLINPEKRCRFSLEDRMEFARLATEGLGVEIAFYDGLAVDYVKSL